MQVESFRVFRDLVETRSFSRSASLNGITQSAVSQQLRSIEVRLRVPLLERTSKQFALTREGQLLYEASREIIGYYQRFLRHPSQNTKDQMDWRRSTRNPGRARWWGTAGSADDQRSRCRT